MINKLLTALGIGLVAGTAAQVVESYTPYKESHVDFLYNLLFCDDISLFKNDAAAKADGSWTTLFAEKPDASALEKIASSSEEESRVRALAYNRLRAAGRAVPSRVLLGVVVEVPMERGLDTLAAYSDGRVRYLNQSGKVAIFEGGVPEVESLAKELVAASQGLLSTIGPWKGKRLPPPRGNIVRITFVVSDGLYFGQGPFQALQQDAIGGPVLAKAAQLLKVAVDAAL
jgi:hypothetical protein